MMLVLKREIGDVITIGKDVIVKVIEVRGDKVRLGIDAPKDVIVLRVDRVEAEKLQRR